MDWPRDIAVESGLLAISRKLGIPGPSTGARGWLGETRWQAMHFVIAIFRPARIAGFPGRASWALARLASAIRREISGSFVMFGVFISLFLFSSLQQSRIDADQAVEIR